jgi:hypothetical protein
LPAGVAGPTRSPGAVFVLAGKLPIVALTTWRFAESDNRSVSAFLRALLGDTLMTH